MKSTDWNYTCLSFETIFHNQRLLLKKKLSHDNKYQKVSSILRIVEGQKHKERDNFEVKSISWNKSILN